MTTSPLRQLLYLLGFACGLALLSPAAHAQTAPPVPMPNALKPSLPGKKVYTYVEQMPVYLQGGMDSLQAFITSHVHGPATGKMAYVTFVVDQNGKVRNPAFVPNNLESSANVDPQLADAFSTIGSFRPGRQNGKPVDVVLTIPLRKSKN